MPFELNSSLMKCLSLVNLRNILSLKGKAPMDKFKKHIFFIAALSVLVFILIPFFGKLFLYAAAYVIWGIMAFFVGNVPLSDILSWWQDLL